MPTGRITGDRRKDQEKDDLRLELDDRHAGDEPEREEGEEAQAKLELAPRFEVGEKVILLLYTKPYDSPVVGFRLGHP